MNFPTIEDGLNNLLQRDIVIFNNLNKPLKKGKFLLYVVKDFYYVLTIQNEKGDLKEYELPLPFNTSAKNDHLNFDYTLDTFAKNNTFVFYKSKVLNFKKKSKLYNTVVVLSALS
tara:strand:+ start:5683 stop:6027 length:345 start_codon:yes stop_codon:yes gene_type:complete